MQKIKMLRYLIVVSSLFTMNLVNCVTVNFNGTIVGDRTILECVNGFEEKIIDQDPEMYTTTSQFARKSGYPAEEHALLTDDGHILTLHRIPGKVGATPVFLQHGLFSSSFDWIVTGKERSLAFKLADAGYDVWLGNFRGSTYSKCHTKYKTSSYEFWNFSWHEMGTHDLPTMITYVTNTTGQKIIYIGHSMGTTAFFVMGIERPDVALQVKAMMALAPVAYMDHATTPYRVLTPYVRLMEILARIPGSAELFSQNPLLKNLVKYACTLTLLQEKLCTDLIFTLTTGFDPTRFNYTLAPDILYHLPAGGSFKTFAHYSQVYNSKRFQYYDYGSQKNLKLYNNTESPEYNIPKIAVPIGVFWSDDDMFSSPVDVMRFYEQLPNKILSHRVDYHNFNHLDYLFATDAPKYVYEKLMSTIERYK